MVQVDAGDHGTVGVDDVDGVQPTPHADLQNGHIKPATRHHIKHGQGGELEVGQRNRWLYRRARALDTRKRVHQRRSVHHLALQAESLLKPHQVW